MNTPDFPSRLIANVRKKDSVLCVGLDPRRESIPRIFLPAHVPTENLSPKEVAVAFEKFSIAVLELVAETCIAVKPQAAFFEDLLEDGYVAFVRVCRAARELGLPVIADIKRGDIGTTAEAYARAYLAPVGGKPPMADCVTVNPYLGIDGLKPFYDQATRHGGGVFVLVKTSNPSSADYQDRLVGELPLYRIVAQDVEKAASASTSGGRYGAVGAVVGATHPRQLEELRSAMPHTWFLVPGYGAQGATADDVVRGADAEGLGIVVNASRSVTFPWGASPPASGEWKSEIRSAAVKARDDLARALGGRRIDR